MARAGGRAVLNRGVPDPVPPTYYRLDPGFTARFVGLALVAAALLVFAATALVAALDLPADVLTVLVVLVVAGILALGWVLRSRSYVLRCDAEGYRVGLVRGAGVKQARWPDVVDAVTAPRHGVPCVVLRLRDGGTTTVPLPAVAGDPDALLRDLKARLDRGHRSSAG